MANTNRILRSAGVAAATLFIVTGGVLAGRAIVEAPGAAAPHDDSSEYRSADGSPMPTLDVDRFLSPLPSAAADVVDDAFLARATPSPVATGSPEATASAEATASPEASQSPDASFGADATADPTSGAADDATAERTVSLDDGRGNSGPGSPNSGPGLDDDDDEDDDGDSGSGSDDDDDDGDDDNSGSGSDD